MQSQIYIGSSKLPTLVTVSEHRFGSFLRTFYEFSYTRKDNQESHIFRGSNIDHCLHGHNWLVCCVPDQIRPKSISPPNTSLTGTKGPETESCKQESTESSVHIKNPRRLDLESTNGPHVEPPPIENGNISTDTPPNSHQKPTATNPVTSDPGFSTNQDQTSSTSRSKLDDPEEFILSAPMYEFYMNQLLNHKSTPKFNVELTLLLPGSVRPRRNPKPPRPPNSFMVYSLHYKQKLEPPKAGKNRTGAQLNKDIGKEWQKLSKEDKEVFTILAAFANHLHSLVYPNYRYQPSPRSFKKRR